MRRRRRWTLTVLGTLAVAALAAGVASGAGGAGLGGGAGQGTGAGRRHVAVIPLPRSAARLLGQRIMVGFNGSVAPPWLLQAVRAGTVGAVILFASNVGGDVGALTAALQHAARAGGNPPVLVAVDQEGGEVKRFPVAPPDRSPPEIAAGGGPGLAFREGASTGAFLRARGINMDLAPVLDVPTTSGSFIAQEGRAFSTNAGVVARYGSAFAAGLQSAGVAAVGKHFPGLGSATASTDTTLDRLSPTPSQRAAALEPYTSAIARGLDGVLVTTAAFPAYDASGAPAAMSSPIIGGLLRGRLHFGGVTLTDSLVAPTGHDPVTAGVLAAEAGADILLYKDPAVGELHALEAALRAGRLSRAAADASYRRIVALKRRLG